MSYILVPIIVVLAVMVVVSLVKGIVAFLQSTKMDLDHDDGGTGATPAQLMQNKMMFARIKYQAAAVVVTAVLLAVSR